MASTQRPLRIADDLRSLPLPPEDVWVRSRRPSSAPIGVLFGLALLLLVLAVVVTAPPAAQGVAATPVVTPAATTKVAASVAPRACQSGQLPLVEHLAFPSPPGDAPGTGAASPEAAFQRARPDASAFAISYPFGSTRSAPAWITAGSETYIAELHGTPEGNNWFVYPARFVGCTVP